MRAPAAIRALALLALLAVRPAVAQLSPGELAAAHAELEGLRNCTQCHQLGSGVSETRCLACHGALAARIGSDEGWHAREETRAKACSECHSDHHGRDFEMVHWPGGQEVFEHEQTGWPLEGAHDDALCADCHRPELLDADWLAAHAEVNAKTSYLGLPTDCAACHADEHRGQFEDGGRTDCASCHALDAWVPAPGFDHGETAYPLEGAHRGLECAACHEAAPRPLAAAGFRVDAADEDGLAGLYRGLAFQRCVDCHRDPHDGALGADCESCHTTATFAVGENGFDHDRTRWPLKGAHRRTACEACHRGTGGETRMRPAFDRCDACHADEHGGQFAGRAAGDDCSACHDESRFSPARFGMTEHADTDWPLEGSHLAVACMDCHRPEDGRPTRYAGLETDCEACHDNVHGDEIAAAIPGEADRCSLCHGPESWSVADYDHGGSRFPLEGRHVDAACAACHRAPARGGELRLKPLPVDCASCHEDAHDGQFALDGATACDRCHGPSDWSASRFDHDRDSAFELDGEHRDLHCSACHGSELIDGKERVRWKPLGSRCSDCHGS